MHILVINCGSSSLKYQLFDMKPRVVLAAGLVEQIGEGMARHGHRWRNAAGSMEGQESDIPLGDHRAALDRVEAVLTKTGVVDLTQLGAIGHRVVHGGEAFQAPVRIDAEVVETIRRLVPLAPLHNPANLLGIELCLERFPQVRCPRWRCSTRPSTKACRPTPTVTHCPGPFTRRITSAATASMAPPMPMWHGRRRRTWNVPWPR